jgi:outer membrane protein OmpA-like peptidoglycan-associated protein
VVARAERVGGRWSLSGLRDPLAAKPSALLAGLTDTATLEQRWEPYLSLQPALVLARARQSLAPPASLALSLAGDTLLLSGSAPLEWVARAARQPALPPGVAALDLSGVRPELPAALADIRREIEGERVFFDRGSAALGRAGRRTAARTAASFSRLRAGVAGLGARATIELVGRTDTTGTEATNHALSRIRAETVRAEFAARGVPAGVIRMSALGTSRPLAATDPAEQQRLNRSLSFGVIVEPSR